MNYANAIPIKWKIKRKRFAFSKKKRNINSSFKKKSLWFRLIGKVIAPLRSIRQEVKLSNSGGWKKKTEEVLTSLMQMILSNMIGHIGLPAILSKLVTDHDEFGDFRFVILGMLDTYHFEETILHTANKLMARDISSAIQNLIRKRNRGVHPKRGHCPVCKLRLYSTAKQSEILLFYCGHPFHKDCVSPTKADSDQRFCPICLSKQKSKSQEPQPQKRSNPQPQKRTNPQPIKKDQTTKK